MKQTTSKTEEILFRGLVVGLKSTWSLAKVIFPITVILVVLQHTPIFPMLISFIVPFMGVLGLRGEAAIPLVLGNALNLYSALAAILSLELTVKEVFILAVMLSFSHNLFIETGVALKVGVKLWVVLLTRLGLALGSAVVINLVWHGGGEVAQYSLAPEAPPVLGSWTAILLHGFLKATYGVIQLGLIIIPMMVAIQYLKDRQYLKRLSAKAGPFTRLLGIHPNATLTLFAGGLFGLVWGAGIMIQAVKEHGVSRKDVTLSLVFLMACHAIIEDTLLFMPLGIPVWPLLLIRLVAAVVITMVVGQLWKQPEPALETPPAGEIAA